jgi:hypothetical protein
MHCESQDFLAEGLLLEPRNFRISVHQRIERSKLLNRPLDDLQRRPLLAGKRTSSVSQDATTILWVRGLVSWNNI